MDLFSNTISTLESSMNLRMDNQRIIAANLANVDTPGYTAQKLDFEASMKNALDGLAQPAVINPSPAEALALDGNNVDMEQELSEMSRNKLLYSVESQLLGAKFRQYTTIFEKDS